MPLASKAEDRVAGIWRPEVVNVVDLGGLYSDDYCCVFAFFNVFILSDLNGCSASELMRELLRGLHTFLETLYPHRELFLTLELTLSNLGL